MRQTTIATAVGEQAETVEEVYEPYLIQEGFLAPQEDAWPPTGRISTLASMWPGNDSDLFNPPA